MMYAFAVDDGALDFGLQRRAFNGCEILRLAHIRETQHQDDSDRCDAFENHDSRSV
jgi:hypothetical protein